MAQHILLSAAARTLSLKAIFSEGEEAAYRGFCRLGWPGTSGDPICPACGCVDVYDLSSGRRFKWAACHRRFSVTSGTIFASGKRSSVDLVGAICLFVNAATGLSAVQLSRDRDVQHKTAIVLMHKRRDAMTAQTRDHRLDGEVEGDGAAWRGYVRPANLREQRVDRRRRAHRRLAHRSGKRRVGVVLRQGGGRTVTRPFLREAQGVGFARKRIAPGTMVLADEIAHWDLLEPDFDMRRINHSEAYSRDGVQTTLAESFFSRLRRMIGGQHLKVEGRYLDAYAAHAAWREDHREESNGQRTDRLIGGALASPVSRSWKGYWHRRAA